MNLEFARPWALLLIPVVPLILWAWRRRPRPSVAWPDAAELVPLAARGVERARFWLRALVLTAASLALAGPRIPLPGDRLESEGIAVMLVLDVSGSMAEPDFDRNGAKVPRLDAVKTAFDELVTRRPQDRIGLVLFATLPETACPLTLDHRAIRHMLQAAEPRGIPTENETNLGDALAYGLERLGADTGHKVLVICSDGEHNVPSPALTPRQAAQLAAAAHVPVYSIDAGPANGPGRVGMEAIARMTGGTYFAANDAQALAQACESIDQMARDVATSDRARRYTEADRALALAACAGLVLSLFLDLGPWLRVP
ncbi:MAG: vWA domain-containing protein [Gemmataceae bacterium]